MQPLFVSQSRQLWSLVEYNQFAENFLRSFPQDFRVLSLFFFNFFCHLPSFFTISTNIFKRKKDSKQASKGWRRLPWLRFEGQQVITKGMKDKQSPNATSPETLQQLKTSLTIPFSKLLFILPSITWPTCLHLFIFI